MLPEDACERLMVLSDKTMNLAWGLLLTLHHLHKLS